MKQQEIDAFVEAVTEEILARERYDFSDVETPAAARRKAATIAGLTIRERLRDMRGDVPVGLPAAWVKPRPVVQWFAGAMEAKLRANDHKRGWRGTSEFVMIQKLLEEVGELIEAVYGRGFGRASREEVLSEAADVGNVAMMLADMAYFAEGQAVKGTGRSDD